MKTLRLLPLLLVGIGFLSLGSQAVFAHVLKTDGSIGAVLHVNPEDDPVAREPATFFFELKDTSGKFTPEACNCFATIEQNGNHIFSSPLFGTNQAVDLETPSFVYTFPQKGAYKVVATGNPKTANAFEPFRLEFTVSVTKIADATVVNKDSSLPAHFYHYIAIGTITAAFLILLFVDRRRAREQKSGDKQILRSLVILAIGLSVFHALPSHVFAMHHTEGTPQAHEVSCCLPQTVALAPVVAFDIPKLTFTEVLVETPMQVDTLFYFVYPSRSPPTAA